MVYGREVGMRVGLSELVLLYGAAESLWFERDESNDEPWV